MAKAWNISATYLLTGEKRPENGTPRVHRPLFGPETPGGTGRGLGAWGVGVPIHGHSCQRTGCESPRTITRPGYVPTFNYHTDEITMGLTWYPNYWVKYQVNLAIDQLKDPSTIGAVPQNYYVVLQQPAVQVLAARAVRCAEWSETSSVIGRGGRKPALKGNCRRGFDETEDFTYYSSVIALFVILSGCGTAPNCPTCGTTKNGAYAVINVVTVPEHNPDRRARRPIQLLRHQYDCPEPRCFRTLSGLHFRSDWLGHGGDRHRPGHRCRCPARIQCCHGCRKWR